MSCGLGLVIPTGWERAKGATKGSKTVSVWLGTTHVQSSKGRQIYTEYNTVISDKMFTNAVLKAGGRPGMVVQTSHPTTWEAEAG